MHETTCQGVVPALGAPECRREPFDRMQLRPKFGKESFSGLFLS